MTNLPKTAEEWDAESASHHQEALDSFERCDTDGALSQWAHGISARKASLEAWLVHNGGKDVFRVEFYCNVVGSAGSVVTRPKGWDVEEIEVVHTGEGLTVPEVWDLRIESKEEPVGYV